LNFTPFLKAGAKLQLFSELPKLFSKKIFVYFNEPAPLSKAGAKVQQLFQLTKYFKKFF